MVTEIYRGVLTLMEHTYFASREAGIYYESEPLIGNYALAYALGWCASPYYWSGPPRYKQDLGPLNEKGVYITPGTFAHGELHYALSQFNAQSDSYYFRFDQNAIATTPQKVKATNFPQSGKIRMLGRGSRASLFCISQQGVELRLPSYIRLGKFNSKAFIEWERMNLKEQQPVERHMQLCDFLLNAVDLPTAAATRLHAFSLYNVHPTPLLRQCRLGGTFWHCVDGQGKEIYLPADMHFGVDSIE